ncbi:MAG: hypothetical protein V4820_07620 [Pseudomonadota bacterium]
MMKITPALFGLLLVGACASDDHETFAKPVSPDRAAAAADYAVDIPTSDEPETPPKR